MFIVTWLFDKIGFMPKPSVKITFSAPQKDYTSHEFEQPIKKPKVVAKKNNQT